MNKRPLLILFTLLFAYFSYHIFQGKRGLIAMLTINAELQNKQAFLDKLTKERNHLEEITKLLQPNDYDLDLVDELSRRSLGLIEPNEKVLIIKYRNIDSSP